jgi:thioester reductase-like protein
MHVLITGVTGFIGSSLAARLLDRGARVTCLARGADGPDRARKAIAEAAAGFSFKVDVSKVDVLPYDFALIERNHAAKLADLDAAWHCAAHMTFNMKKLREAIDFNVGGTVALVEMLARVAPKKPRFYYMSTAYTGGVEATVIDEKLHLAPHVVNPYFVSKWAMELVLEKLSRADGSTASGNASVPSGDSGVPSGNESVPSGDSGVPSGRHHERSEGSAPPAPPAPPALPITVYRPTLVIGHTETGWYGGESYGLYNFLDAVWAGYIAGGTSMRIDIAPGTMHNYLPIDDLVYNAIALTELTTNREQFEVLIEEGTDNTNTDRLAWIAEGMDLALSLGKPRTVSDFAADFWIAVNKPFNRPEAGVRPFPFKSGKIAAMLGSQFRHHVLDHDIHVRLARWYKQNRLGEIERKVRAKGIVRTVRLANATGLSNALPKRPAGGLVAKEVARAHGLI